ncbi:HAD family hydrolase [Metaclostridioides mangenotii]|uniref:HAD family hydrolase n=1 Tax=Metaclostridioides mangenotii TaxID=1540 RepID=UPI0031D4EAD9
MSTAIRTILLKEEIIINTNFDIVLFDLDGTLTDPKEGITKSIQYSLKSFGIEEDRENLVKFIGPPLYDTFKSDYGFDDEKVIKAVEKFREYFKEKGLYENKIYPGIEALIRELHVNGKKIVLATSKPTVFAEKILHNFSIYKYFDNIVGSNLDGTRSDKEEVIRFAIKDYLEFDKTSIVMVGDRKYDIIGANKIGINSIGVLYGYGALDEIKDSKPNYVAESVDKLINILF